MKFLKIALSHLVLWFVFSGITGAILGPEINIEKTNIDEVSKGIPTSVLIFSMIYLLLGWLIPYKYFNEK